MKIEQLQTIIEVYLGGTATVKTTQTGSVDVTFYAGTECEMSIQEWTVDRIVNELKYDANLMLKKIVENKIQGELIDYKNLIPELRANQQEIEGLRRALYEFERYTTTLENFLTVGLINGVYVYPDKTLTYDFYGSSFEYDLGKAGALEEEIDWNELFETLFTYAIEQSEPVSIEDTSLETNKIINDIKKLRENYPNAVAKTKYQLLKAALGSKRNIYWNGQDVCVLAAGVKYTDERFSGTEVAYLLMKDADGQSVDYQLVKNIANDYELDKKQVENIMMFFAEGISKEEVMLQITDKIVRGKKDIQQLCEMIDGLID